MGRLKQAKTEFAKKPETEEGLRERKQGKAGKGEECVLGGTTQTRTKSQIVEEEGETTLQGGDGPWARESNFSLLEPCGGDRTWSESNFSQ